MNKSCIAPALLVLLILTSGPLYLPLALASTDTTTNQYNQTDTTTNHLNQTITYPTNGTLTQPDERPIEQRIKQPTIRLTASNPKGESPLPVRFTCEIENEDTAKGILLYAWDFDGDGKTDKVTFDENQALYVYETKKPREYNTSATIDQDKVLYEYEPKKPKEYNASVTVGFKDGTYKQATLKITVDPTDPNKWHEIKEIGASKLGICTNGTIIVYDENSWLPITFTESNQKISENRFTGIDPNTRRISYPISLGQFNVTVTYGVAGKAQLRFEEFTPTGVLKPENDRIVQLPLEKQEGNIDFSLIEDYKVYQKLVTEQPVLYDKLDQQIPKMLGYSTLPLLYQYNGQTYLIPTGDGPVYGEVGSCTPWLDQGITPYGEYFVNNQEYVSMHTGFLTLTATDLTVPGRGLDFIFKRVYAPPTVYEGEQPATAPDYSYQDYPWAPMGNGWMLGYPWIELKGANPAYIRFPGGQRYPWDGASEQGKEYHCGDQFTLVGHANGNYTLYTIDGVRYDFDSSYKPRRISDTNGNKIFYQYTGNVITSITDTIGRTIILEYGVNGCLSNVSLGESVVSYGYEAGNNGYCLVNVTDPVGRVTTYTYLNDYLINKIFYPTGGSTWYTYSVFEDAGYRKYRVSSQAKYPNLVPINSTLIELDKVKNIAIFLNPHEWGFVHALDWVGDQKYTNSSFMWLWWMLQSDYYHLYKGYLEWDISRVDDDGDIRELYYYYHCNRIDDPSASGGITEMSYRPSLSNATVIFDDISSGTNYKGSGFFPSLGTNRVIDLNAAARTHLENMLGEDWFAIGLSWIGAQSGKICQFNTDTNAQPRGTLQVIYDCPVKAAYVEGASYLSFDFESTFHNINNTIIINSNGLETTKTTRLDYKQSSFTETVWNGTTSDSRLYLKNTVTEATRRRVRVEHYPGTSIYSVNKTIRYDDWGNAHYVRDFLDHESYFSYANTDSENTFNNTDGNKVTYFTDSFYSNSVRDKAHNVLIGKAEYQDGPGSPTIESYYRYDSRNNLIESKSLLAGDWVRQYYDYDEYGNLVRITDPEGNKMFYEYNSTYHHAYLTKYMQQLLGEMGGENLTRHYGYDTNMGYPIYSVDELGNRTDYTYDDIGRVLSVTYPVVDGVRCGKLIVYDDSENSVTTFDENNVKVTSHYDGLGRRVLVERYNGSNVYSCEHFLYDWDNRLAVHVLPTGYNYTYYYDANGKLLATVNPDGSKSRVSYDYFYNIKTVYDEEDRKKVYCYDWSDRLIEVREYNDTICYYATFYGYNEVGQRVSVTTGNFFKPVNYEQTFTPIADAYIRAMYPNNNYGSVNLQLKEGETDFKSSLIRFNTSSIPREAKVTDATFSIYCTTISGTDKDMYVEACKIRSDWDEYTVTYNTEPSANTSLTKSRFLDINNDNAYLDFSVREHAQYWVRNPHKNFGLLVWPYNGWAPHNDYVTVYSREASSAYRPKLEVQYAAYTKYGLERTTSYTYDQLGRVTRIDYPDESYETFTYDKAGNVIQKRDCNGNYIYYTYDSLNRLLLENTTTLTGLSGWIYRKEITVTSESGAVSDYPISMTLHYGSGTDSGDEVYLGGRCQTDFGDIRFTSSDGLTMLDYWIQEKADSDRATIWVKVPYIYASPATASIFLYYGVFSSVSSTSSGEETFLFFDDFNGSSLNPQWNDTQGNPTVANSTVILSHQGGVDDRIMANGYSWNEDVQMHFRVKYSNDSVVVGRTGLAKASASDPFNSDDCTYIESRVDAGQSSTVNPSTVASHSNTQISGPSFQRKTFMAHGLYWVFYSDTTNMVYRTSADGSSWSSATTVRSCTSSNKFSIWFDGTYVHYVYCAGTSGADIYYRRGTVNSDGTITWSTQQNAKDNSSGRYAYRVTIAVTTSGYPAIGFELEIDGGSNTARLLTNTKNDGTWTTGIYHQLGSDSIGWHTHLTPLSNGNMAVFWTQGGNSIYYRQYKCDAGSWSIFQSNTISISSHPAISYNGGVFSFVSNEDLVHILYQRATTYQVVYVAHNVTSNEYTAPSVLTSKGADSGSYPSASICMNTGDVYAFWVNSTKIMCIKNLCGIWDSKPFEWVDESALGLASKGISSSYHGNETIPVIWNARTSDPRYLRFKAYVMPDFPYVSTVTGDDGAYSNNPIYSIYDAETWYTGSIKWVSGIVLYEFNGTTRNQTSMVPDEALSPRLEGNDSMEVMDVDWVFVGKYVYPEPVFTSSAAVMMFRRSYTYDNTGRVAESYSDDMSVSYGYDARGRVMRERFNGLFSVEYSYDNASNIVEMVYPDGSKLTLLYDELNRLNEVIGYASLTYTLVDSLDVVTYGNGVETVYSYDSMNRPVDIETVKDAATLLSLTYTYDKSGSVTSISNGTYTESYSYDLLDRLSSAVGSWGGLSFGYDAVGNRLSKSVQGGSTITYSYDSMDRLVGATGMGFGWDLNGNMVYMDDGAYAWNYTYDPLNRLTMVKRDGVLSARYMYDAGGRRVRSWDTVAGTTDYVYSGLNVVDEVKSGAHEKHVYAGLMHLASNSSGTVEYYHVDHLGSTRLKTSGAGAVIYESNYEPYGPGYGESGSEEFRYTGKQEDPTGLYYYGARYYDPVTGRFITRDSVFGDLSDPQSLNRYSYCINNPHKYVDLTGLWGVQIGFDIGATLPTGFGASFGIGIALTEDKRKGTQIAWYVSRSSGFYLGTGGLGGGIVVEYTSQAETMEDLAGPSIDTQFTLGPSGKLGLGSSVNINEGNIEPYDKPGIIAKFEIGSPEATVQVYYSVTTTYKFYSRKPDLTPERDRWWEDTTFYDSPDVQ